MHATSALSSGICFAEPALGAFIGGNRLTAHCCRFANLIARHAQEFAARWPGAPQGRVGNDTSTTRTADSPLFHYVVMLVGEVPPDFEDAGTTLK